MPSKVQLYAQMADRTAEQITGSYQKWTAFLTTAARLYKYPYNEQLMIFAQRPEATACAGYDLWNKQMRRYVRRGSKGIALVDTSSDQPKLRYVFDVSDTGGGENSRRDLLFRLCGICRYGRSSRICCFRFDFPKIFFRLFPYRRDRLNCWG